MLTLAASLVQDKPLLDFVFAVSHPSHWHAVNMQQHPHHYSVPMRMLGSDAVAWMQEKGLGAGVWFNVEVEVNGKVCHCKDRLIRSSADWNGADADHQVRRHFCRCFVQRHARLGNVVYQWSYSEAGMYM